MNKNQDFFIKSVEKFANELYKIGDTELLTLLKNQKINRDILLDEIGKILLKYNISNDVMAIDKGVQVKIYSNISELINKLVGGELKTETTNLGQLLTTIGIDKFYSTSYLLDLGMDFDIKKVTKKQLMDIIDKTIQGKNYSDRYKANKEAIAKTLKAELKKFLNGETSVNKISDIIKEKYNINANFSKRLVGNEVARVQIATNELWQEEHKEYIKEVMWSATLENTTCEECGDLDGQRWDKDTNYPLPIESTHVGCRCCIIALPNKGYRPQTRLDNNTKEKISWKTYNEWKENNI